MEEYPYCSTDFPRGIGFYPTLLWNISQSLIAFCPTTPHLTTSPNTPPRLSPSFCAALAPNTTLYQTASIWLRLTTWKLPLLQLVSQTSKPPLGFKVEVFVIVRLVGDPVGTVWSLLRKVEGVAVRAREWKGEDGLGGEKWKEWALMVASFDEWGWGVGRDAKEKLKRRLNSSPNTETLDLLRHTSRSLAADRSTKFLPILISLLLFISALILAFVSILTSPPNANIVQDPITVEAHSIGFSALYFYIMTAVFLSSIIGVSQSELAMPRVLERLGLGVNAEEVVEGEIVVLGEEELLRDTDRRIGNGGVYSWQPWDDGDGKCHPGTLYAISLVTVLIGPIAGSIISYLTPPDGWDCRHSAYAPMTFLYLLSAALDFPIKTNFKAVFWKDLIMAFANIFTLGIAQLGIFNRCSCWNKFGRVGLVLAQETDVADLLAWRFRYVFLPIVIICIFFQIAICVAVGWYFKDAFRVLLQRDDGESNAYWLRGCCGGRRWRGRDRESDAPTNTRGREMDLLLRLSNDGGSGASGRVGIAL